MGNLSQSWVRLSYFFSQDDLVDGEFWPDCVPQDGIDVLLNDCLVQESQEIIAGLRALSIGVFSKFGAFLIAHRVHRVVQNAPNFIQISSKLTLQHFQNWQIERDSICMFVHSWFSLCPQ